MTTSTLEPNRVSTSGAWPGRAATPGLGVLIVETEGWLSVRLRALVESETGLRLAGVANTAEEGLRMVERRPVDVVMAAHRPRGWSGLRLCCELKRTRGWPRVVICSAYPDGVLAACCVVAEADALVSRYDCDAELADIVRRVGSGARLLPLVSPRVGAMLLERLDPIEHAIFSVLLAGMPAADVARGFRMSRAEFRARQSTLLDKVELLPPASGRRY